MSKLRISVRWLALVITSSLIAEGAMACDGVVGAKGSPLQTRKPVVGQKAWLAAGFGIRMHPLLNLVRMHTGVDWAAPEGTPVITAAAGRVISTSTDGAYGNKVVIDHGGGWQTLYAQLLRFNIREGDCVEAREAIGAVGNTGLSTGSHLHYEVIRNGRPIDPMLAPLKKHVNFTP
jgi:murein DD-endopeptidase MepM/ murein hydrolase activator NlpD